MAQKNPENFPKIRKNYQTNNGTTIQLCKVMGDLKRPMNVLRQMNSGEATMSFDQVDSLTLSQEYKVPDHLFPVPRMLPDV